MDYALGCVQRFNHHNCYFNTQFRDCPLSPHAKARLDPFSFPLYMRRAESRSENGRDSQFSIKNSNSIYSLHSTLLHTRLLRQHERLRPPLAHVPIHRSIDNRSIPPANLQPAPLAPKQRPMNPRPVRLIRVSRDNEVHDRPPHRGPDMVAQRGFGARDIVEQAYRPGAVHERRDVEAHVVGALRKRRGQRVPVAVESEVGENLLPPEEFAAVRGGGARRGVQRQQRGHGRVGYPRECVGEGLGDRRGAGWVDEKRGLWGGGVLAYGEHIRGGEGGNKPRRNRR